MPEAVGELEVRGAGEEPIRETGSIRITHAHGEQAFGGALAANRHVDWPGRKGFDPCASC